METSDCIFINIYYSLAYNDETVFLNRVSNFVKGEEEEEEEETLIPFIKPGGLLCIDTYVNGKHAH